MANGLVFNNAKQKEMRTITIFLLSSLMITSCNAQDRTQLKLVAIIDSLNLKGFKTGFTISNRYLIYGDVDTVYSENEKGFSDLQVIDARYNDNRRFWFSGELFCDETRSFCMPKEYVKVKKEGEMLSLTYFLSIPSGPGWKYELQPILRQTLKTNQDSLFIISKEFILKLENEFPNPTKELREDYKKIKSEGINHYFKDQQGTDFILDFLIRLFISSFYDEGCKELFVDLPNGLPEITEGLPGEIYYSWAIIYNTYAKENNEQLIPTY